MIALEPRDIEVYSAELLDLERDPRADSIWWDVRFSVSKGTYTRALARDVGAACETCAHVETLRRTRAGVLDVEDCLSLDALERYGIEAAIDPVFLLESRMAFLDDGSYADVCNGKPLRASELSVYEAPHRFDADDCGSRRCAVPATSPLHDGELVCLVYGNDLKALYAFDAKTGKVSPKCVFSQGVTRGKKSIRSTKHSTTHCLLALGARSACSTVCIGAIGSLSTRRSAPLQKAAASGSPSAFDIDPDERFHADRLKKLMTNEQRVKALADTGVDCVVVLPFTPAFSAQSPMAFMDATFGGCAPYAMHVGTDFRFGAKAAGTVSELHERGDSRGTRICSHDLKSFDGRPITATRIRLLFGRLRKVAAAIELLGHPVYVRRRGAAGPRPRQRYGLCYGEFAAARDDAGGARRGRIRCLCHRRRRAV